MVFTVVIMSHSKSCRPFGLKILQIKACLQIKGDVCGFRSLKILMFAATPQTMTTQKDVCLKKNTHFIYQAVYKSIKKKTCKNWHV